MRKKLFCTLLLVALGTAAFVYLKKDQMLKIEFALGKNIVETAKLSGVPRFNVSNVDGFIQYDITPTPPDIPFIFNKVGYEIRVMPAFSFSLTADRHRTPNDIVQGAGIILDGRFINSHKVGRETVENLINQFNNSQWKRYISPSCPAVTGRSSLLNELGESGSRSCAFDPHYQINSSEWVKIFKTSQYYEWIGDGVFARLTVSYDDDIRGITYNISVDFDDYKTKLAVASENEARENKEGDAKGWNTSANAAKNLITVAERIKILEANAIKRGDTVIPR